MASSVTRLTVVTAALSLLALGSPAQAAAPGSNLFASAATCYGGAVRSYFDQGRSGGDAGPYRTTTRCRDINVRNASQYGVNACVIFIDRTGACNYRTYLPSGSNFITVATDVRDGVRFKVRFETLRYEVEPLIAYHAF
ncbi:hypothetical protein E1193_18150 [Micromonospora sp. KC606]|uniref:hypothetical protein n=1 Tax=Micromonospora sp. KC606 TaxID=2530379 RepID=UPI001043E125|nr:hypothetical protein [Micromonospora sp. KC606]TDC79999.1 hypothetical protein E1193_18150 [Micromonospora sp. KC606]